MKINPNTTQKYNVLRIYSFIILIVAVYLPSGIFAQEKQDTVKISQEQLDQYNEVKKAAKKDKAVKSVLAERNLYPIILNQFSYSFSMVLHTKNPRVSI